MAYNLGKMKRIDDLRSVWPHEANDFTKWLSDEQNLAILSDIYQDTIKGPYTLCQIS